MATYVISDLHGQYNAFCAILQKIEFCNKDHLYILGDVIDRGPDGIKILTKCMQNTQITLLLGNHEDIMLHMLEAVHKNSDDLPDICAAWWLNGGEATARTLFAMNDTEIETIETYLRSCPLCLTIKAGHNTFLMAHACPVNLTEEQYRQVCLQYTKENKKNTNCEIADYRECLLWQRVEEDDEFPENVVAVFGHTPTAYYQTETPYKMWSYQNKICIDCGLSAVYKNDRNARLCCLRLEDKKDFYISPYDI